MIKELTCIVCPKGCALRVELENQQVLSVTGNACPRGKQYAIDECTHPTRTLTTTARTADGGVVSVKTDRAIPKELMFDCMAQINRTVVSLPVRVGDVILENILGTGANVIATMNL
ncbi:MAG: DUF1667 domain-containing protein [Clostridia bacterium]|nr:DUF1667 domain-containing protein [Clostridia bacterium]